MKTDVLIVGSGIAGLVLALRAAEQAEVVVISKRRAEESNTNWAQGGIAAVFDGHDSFARHEADTLKAGAGLCDRDVVRAVVREAPERVRELAAIARRIAETHGAVEAAAYRDAIGLGRKRTVQILEFFDRVGYTRRVRDAHRLRDGVSF